MSKNKKKNQKKIKKKASKQSLIIFSIILLWRFIKLPVVFSSIGLLLVFLWMKHNGDYDKLRSSVANIFEVSQDKSDLVLENILLDGHINTPKEEIIAAITGDEAEGKVKIGSPLMKINLWKVKARLEKLTWIKSASVTRQFPSTLSISMVERQPMALWQHNGKVNIIDSDGEVINEHNLEKFSNLFILVGKEVPYHAANFIKFTSSTPQIAKMIKSGIFVNDRRWDINLKNGILIKLPEDNAQKAWEYLSIKQNESKILESNIKVIDLRIEKKMFVK